MKKTIITSVCVLMFGFTSFATALPYNGSVDNENGLLAEGISKELKLEWLNNLKTDLEQYIAFLQNNADNVDLDKFTGNNGKHWGQLLERWANSLGRVEIEEYDSNVAPPQDNAPVPEPATLLLLGSGLSGLAMWGKRRRKLSA